MKIIDWNTPSTFVDLFQNITILGTNAGHFNPDNISWIKNVTNDFGDDDNSIAQNLLNHFQKEVDAIKCYHGTRLLYPRKIKREGLKKLSPNLIFKLCKQAGYYPNNTEKKFIRKKLEEFILHPDGVGERRSHVYLNMDKYLYMFDEETNDIAPTCSFFWGSEGIHQILPDNISTQVNQSMQLQGTPSVVTVHLPLSNKFLNEHMLSIATHFFSSWFNLQVLDQPQFPCHIGLNIPRNINPRYIKEILTFPRYKEVTARCARSFGT